MKASKHLLGFCIITFVSTSISAQTNDDFTGWESVVDYGDSGYEESGLAWRTWGFGPAVGNSYRYLSYYEQGRPRVGSAYWTEIMPTLGIYEVWASFRKTENRTDNANFNVLQLEQAYTQGDENSELVSQSIVNQLSLGNDDFLTWESLGRFTWQQGQQIIVQLDGTDDNQSDEADAIKWVLIEEIKTKAPLNILPVITLLLQ